MRRVSIKAAQSFNRSSLHSILVLAHNGEEGGVDVLFHCKVRFNKINMAFQSILEGMLHGYSRSL